MEKIQNPWSVPVAVEDIPETGLHVEIEAPGEARAGLAAVAGLRDLPRLSAVFDLARRGASVRVTGQVNAQVGQTCVVTLEPVESDVEEMIDMVFAASPGDYHDAGDEEPPEPLIGGQLDLGAIATEFLLLGIDPYPRKAGAEFMPPKADDGGARPFAALEALKKRLSGG
jgi:Large ribosomal RNA subunit accumulation protein YceD